jgi:Ca2+-binding RTX toxin-like protein
VVNGNAIDLSRVDFTFGPNASAHLIKLNGTSGNDTMVGSDQADVMTGSAGDDTMAGGAGDDTFVFGADVFGHMAFGHDVVTDFGNGRDHIELDHTVLSDFADVRDHLTQTRDGAVITFDAHNSIALAKVAASHLTASDFEFV